MPASLEYMTHRLEISDLLVDYCYAVDEQNWDQLDNIFTADAVLDFTQVGGERNTLPAIKAYLSSTLPVMFSRTQHLISGSKVSIDGEHAVALTMCHNPMVLRGNGTGSSSTPEDVATDRTMTVAFWYRDELVLTPEGWRISKRVIDRLGVTIS